MTKEELKQKAYEYAIKEIPFIECITQNDLEILVQQAYITGAEPREKRIAKLESQNKELKKWLKEKFESCASENLSFVAKYDTVCQELDSCKAKIAELEAQILKMKCCGNCRFSESDKLNGTFCHREGCFVVASAKCKLWEN